MMSYIFKHVDGIFNKLLAREKDLINQARIKMLEHILVLYAFFTGALVIAYSLDPLLLLPQQQTTMLRKK